MEYGIMFFANDVRAAGADKYRLLLDAARFADQHGFASVWTPERHFHKFGSLFPNPSVTSAALATITQRVQLRAGSLISPLHNPIRIAEEWSVVDNLSGGRAAISFGSGWNVNDFIFFPERYAERQKVMYQQIETVRRLWRGEAVSQPNSYGNPVEVTLCPEPLQPELPIWVTSSGNEETFVSAGRIGANLLTHLIGQDLPTLGRKIETYRAARAESGHPPETGVVTLMLHTHLGRDEAAVKARVKAPFQAYLRSAVELEIKAARGGGAISGGHRIQAHDIGETDMAELMELTFERYWREGSLLGTAEGRVDLVNRLRGFGVDEIACLIDFFDDAEAILESLPHLAELQSLTSTADEDEPIVSGFLDDLD